MSVFAFPEERTQEQAERIFWCRGVVLCISILLVLPLFALVATALDGVKSWQQNKAWYVMAGSAENPYVCQRNRSCDLLEVDWVKSSEQGKCWRLFRSDPTTYSRAKSRCEQDASELAIISSEVQNEEVHRICEQHQPCWIGLTRAKDEQFRWVDGTRPDYKNWADDPSGGDAVGDLHHERKDADEHAVLGFHRMDLKAVSQRVQDIVAEVFMMFVNVAIMTAVCGLVYQALLAKSSNLLWCAIFGDIGCACCCCIWIMLAVGHLLNGDGEASPENVVSVLLALLQTVALVVLAGLGVNFNNKLCQIVPVTQVTIGEVGMHASSSASMGSGSVVIGMPVHVQQPTTPVMAPSGTYGSKFGNAADQQMVRHAADSRRSASSSSHVHRDTLACLE